MFSGSYKPIAGRPLYRVYMYLCTKFYSSIGSFWSILYVTIVSLTILTQKPTLYNIFAHWIFQNTLDRQCIFLLYRAYPTPQNNLNAARLNLIQDTQ